MKDFLYLFLIFVVLFFSLYGFKTFLKNSIIKAGRLYIKYFKKGVNDNELHRS